MMDFAPVTMLYYIAQLLLRGSDYPYSPDLITWDRKGRAFSLAGYRKGSQRDWECESDLTGRKSFIAEMKVTAVQRPEITL